MCKNFFYKEYKFNPLTGQLDLHYTCGEYDFMEQLIFPNAPFNLSPLQEKALNSVFFLLHIAFGISYYKAFVPENLIVESGDLTAVEAKFFEKFYLHGLGQFAVENNLCLENKIHFPVNLEKREAVSLNLSDKTLIPVGGGKDSCVVMELMKKMGKSGTAVSVRGAKAIIDCVSVSGYPYIMVDRKISPKLLELNKQGLVLNGHVPITGMLAFALFACGILYDHKYVALAAERSANVGNCQWGNLQANHQYSKSFEFEKDFFALTQTIVPEFWYFSALRPLSEINIAKLFAKYCSAYYDVFTSCNHAFHISAEKRIERWCANCDKCRFVFLILAPFLPKEKLIELVGKNLLDDSAQLQGYKELLGLDKNAHKPFECVGEEAESRWAFLALSEKKEWNLDFIVKELRDLIPKEEGILFNYDTQNNIPPAFLEIERIITADETGRICK